MQVGINITQPLNLPRSITLHLTENCTLRCRMCYYFGVTGVYSQNKIKRKPETLNIERIKEVINFLTSANLRYSQFGGEPFVYPHLEELIL